MTRYTLHVPLATNAGRHLGDLHHTLEDVLVNQFGGFTLIYGRGGWRGDKVTITEDVVLYMIDTEDTGIADVVLRRIAEDIKREAEQEAVYLTAQDEEGFRSWLI